MIEDLRYNTDEWRSKRKEILERDNYTCQMCKTFNPSEGTVQVFNEKEKGIELHSYDSRNSIYTIASQPLGLNVNFEYGWGLWLVTPILQVHHLLYIQGKESWEYDNKNLITLCNECHQLVHKNRKIPIYDSNLNLIEEKKFIPEDNNTGRKHDFKPWHFIIRETGEYKLSNVQPRFICHLLEDDMERLKEVDLEKTIQEMYAYFMERFFPNYSTTPP